jgi:hypothetical protein
MELQRLLIGEGGAFAADRALIVGHEIWFLFDARRFQGGMRP